MNPTNNDTPRQDAAGHDQSQQDDISRDQYDNHLANNPGQKPEISQMVSETNHDTTIHDKSRPDVPLHDSSRLDTPEHDVARPDAAEQNEEGEASDTVLNPEVPDWVEIDQTISELKQLGIIRTVRSIQRYCKNGKLSCQLAPTENGVRYLIKQKSIGEFVKRHNQTMPSLGFGSRSESDEQVNDQRTVPQSELTESQVTHSNQQSELILSLKDQQIDMLTKQLEITNKQLDMKDEQISAMLERDHETNVLIQNLQNLVALPSGDSSRNNSSNVRSMDVQ